MSDFDKFMQDLGVKPINKTEKTKKNKKKSEISDKTDIFSADNYEKNNSKPKVKSVDSFEEALKLYKPEKAEGERKEDFFYQKAMFHERFSELEQEDILHTIDLHGKTLEEAQNIVKSRLVWCYEQQFDVVLIITGKGKHSDNGPVLKIGIKKLLSDMPELVDYFEYASRMLGGEGAYVVKLRL